MSGPSEEEAFARGFREGSMLAFIWAAVMFIVVIPWLFP